MQLAKRSIGFFFFALLGSAAAAHGQLVPDLVYLRFEDPNPAIAHNDAFPGIGVDAVQFGSATINSGAAVMGNGSMITGAFTSDGYTFQNATFPQSQSYTTEFWIQLFTTIPTTFVYFGPACGPTPPLGAAISHNLLTVYNLIIWTNGAILNASNVLINPMIGNWAHIAIVSDAAAAQRRLYVNGNLVNTAATTASYSLASALGGLLMVGGGQPSACPTGLQTGQNRIDDFRFWSTVRTQAEIQANMTTDLFQSINFLGQSNPAPITFNTAQQTFQSVGILDLGGSFAQSQVLPPYALPAGTTMVVSGSYTGTDLTGLSDVTLTPTSVQLTAVPSTDELLLQGTQTALTGPPLVVTYAGPTALVRTYRPLIGTAAPTVTRIGQGSSYLSIMERRFQSAQNWSLLVQLGAGGPRVAGVVADYSAGWRTAESRLTTDGAGSVLLGDVAMGPNAQLFHIFDIQPVIAPGTGPLFGLDFNPTVLGQLQLPFPLTPFKVTADALGSYQYLAGPGSVPPGLTVDTITFAFPAPNTGLSYVSPVRRVVF